MIDSQVSINIIRYDFRSTFSHLALSKNSAIRKNLPVVQESDFFAENSGCQNSRPLKYSQALPGWKNFIGKRRSFGKKYAGWQAKTADQSDQ